MVITNMCYNVNNDFLHIDILYMPLGLSYIVCAQARIVHVNFADGCCEVEQAKSSSTALEFGAAQLAFFLNLRLTLD